MKDVGRKEERQNGAHFNNALQKRIEAAHMLCSKKKRPQKRKTLMMLTVKMVSLRNMTLEEVYTPRTSAFCIIGTALCRCQRKASGLNVFWNEHEHVQTQRGVSPHAQAEAHIMNLKADGQTRRRKYGSSPRHVKPHQS